MSTQIRPYEPTADREPIFQLWEAAFGEVWPLYPEAFYVTIDSPSPHHLVAESDGTLAGLAAGSRDGQHRANIIALVVRPECRGEGVETMLLEAATQHFRTLGVTKLRFGGGQSYFWPGTPTDQPHIVQLLEQCGWQAGGQITDMVGDIETSRVPSELIDRITHSDAHLRLATAEDGPAILAFEEEHFPEWRPTAAMRVEHEDFANILLAELDGMVVGTNFLTSPGDPGFLWARMLGEDCAAYGAIGVSEAHRGHYIGYALATRAAEILKARGARKIFLGWVFSTEWYGRLGFQAWKTYQEMYAELT
jgi:N-acetylglutamate synthase-like GNAT family acetyltransferase